MATTKNIADLVTISGNSASVLGKTGTDVGYIEGLFDAQGKIAGLEDLQTKVTQLEQIKTQFESLQTELEKKAVKDEVDTELEKKVDMAIDGANGRALISNESDGGLMKFEKNDGLAAAVCVNDGSNDLYAQLYAVDSTRKGVRLNVKKDAIYYTKGQTTPVTTADDELVVKKDLAGLGATVEQVYSATSENAQSGKAVAEAVAGKVDKVIKSGIGTAYLNNESNGGLIKFTATDGSFGKITTYDGSDSEHTLLQLVASTEDTSSVARINFTTTGAYYSKTKSGPHAIADNELVTKKDLQDLISRIEALEAKNS